MKKSIFAVLGAVALLLGTAGAALAAPNNAQNNPQIVANYPTGDHGIPGEPYLHQGSDVVMQAGNSGNFQQWFYGTSQEPGANPHGDHSVWMFIGSGTQCPDNGWILVPNANPSWGDYLQPGNYCVHTNDFHPSH